MPHHLSPDTVVGRFQLRAQERQGQPLWYHQEGTRWQPTTWGEARALVEDVAAGLLALGVEPGQRVALLSRNHPRWVVADYAAQHAGGVVVPIYPTSAPEQIRHILSHASSRVCFVEDATQLAIVREAGTDPQQVVVLMPGGNHEAVDLGTLAERGRKFQAAHPEALSERLAAIRPEHAHSVIFTSGTTGTPKGAVLTHHNLVWTAEAAGAALSVRKREVLISYLPLAHVLERIAATVLPLVVPSDRFSTWFVPELSRLPSALRQVRPTIFVGVPIVFEKMRGRILAELAAGGRWRRAVVGLALSEEGSEASALRTLIARRLVGRRVMGRLGLSRCWYAVSGAASLVPETQRFFQTLGLPLHQGFGLTETSALCTVQRPNDLDLETVGAPLDGVEVRIAPDGEILVRGPNVFSGYDADPVQTTAVFDPDGWLRTGDVGRVEGDRLWIVDRKKSVLITTSGRKVAPQPIEQRLAADTLIEGAMLIGEGRPYLIALIALDPKEAAALAGDEVGEVGLWDHPAVRERVGSAVEGVNRTLAKPDAIKAWIILPFGFPDEALTPTLKVKRQVVERVFSDQIESLYA